VEEIFVSHTHALLVSGLSKLDDTWQHCPNDQAIMLFDSILLCICVYHVCEYRAEVIICLRKLILFFCLDIGSVIKHQLVAHLALGIALRGVLDALRKSIDSKVCLWLFSFSCIYSPPLLIYENSTSDCMMVADVYVWYNSVGAVYGASN
jgi:hypothetical protein